MWYKYYWRFHNFHLHETNYENGSISMSSKGWVICAMLSFLANWTHTIIDWLKKILYHKHYTLSWKAVVHRWWSTCESRFWVKNCLVDLFRSKSYLLIMFYVTVKLIRISNKMIGNKLCVGVPHESALGVIYSLLAVFVQSANFIIVALTYNEINTTTKQTIYNAHCWRMQVNEIGFPRLKNRHAKSERNR